MLLNVAGAGDLAVAYVLYELAKPVRVVITLVATQMLVAALRRRGYMATPAEQDKIRNLVREGTQQTRVHMLARRKRLQSQMGERRRVFGARFNERRLHFNERRLRVMRQLRIRLNRNRRKPKSPSNPPKK